MQKCPSVWACNILVGHKMVFHEAPLRSAKISASEMLARASWSCGYPSLPALSFEPLLTDVPIDVGKVHVHPFSHALERPPVNYREGNILKRTVGRQPWRRPAPRRASLWAGRQRWL